MKRFIAYLLLCCSMLVSAVSARAEAPLRYAATAPRVADKLAEGYAS